MLDLSQTYQAVEHLLNLLRCDHCTAPLHRPFTTGVCEHLICASCRSGDHDPSSTTCCPVCKIPVHSRDFQLHPQISQLVLVARRLRKLTAQSTSLISSPRESPVSHDVQETGLDELDSRFKEPAPGVVIKPKLLSSRVGGAIRKLEPRVVLKRAYSSASSSGSLANSVSDQASTANINGGSNLDAEHFGTDTRSLASSSLTHASVKSEPSITRKPHRRRPRMAQNSLASLDSSVSLTKLPACSSDTINTTSHKWIDESFMTANPSRTDGYSPKGVHSDSMEMVLKAASRVHRTRSMLRSGNREEPPIASPECSIITNSSPTNQLDSNPLPTNTQLQPNLKAEASVKKPPSKPRTRLASFGSAVRNTKLTRSNSSSFLQVLQKFRPNSKGESVLHRAAIRGDLDQVNRYLQSGVSADLRDHAGWTSLHEAVLHGHVEVVKALLTAGATVDIPGGPDLDTPLHDAIHNMQPECCKILLAHGANPILPNGLGMTPLQLVDASIITSTTDSSGKGKRRGSTSAPKCVAIQHALSDIRTQLLSAIGKKKTQLEMKKEEDAIELVNDNTITVEAANSFTFLERRRLRPVLLATGLSRQQQATFTRVANMIHARVVTTISSEVTHVITGASQEFPNVDKTGRKPQNRKKAEGGLPAEVDGNYRATCPRTLKFLNAVLLGCWVLSFDWIETCAHVKMRVEEEGFEVTGCSATPQSGAPRRARLSREAGSIGLFHGMRMCFLGTFVYPVPPRDDLVTLARSGGATIVFSRERCSPLRLARLALETGKPSSPNWELIASGMDDKDEESGDVTDDVPIRFDSAENTNSPLLVVYDSGHSGETNRSLTDSHPYAVQVLKQVLNIIRPRTHPTPSLPVRAIPSTWLLDCAAEYTVLPYPNT